MNKPLTEIYENMNNEGKQSNTSKRKSVNRNYISFDFTWALFFYLFVSFSQCYDFFILLYFSISQKQACFQMRNRSGMDLDQRGGGEKEEQSSGKP